MSLHTLVQTVTVDPATNRLSTAVYDPAGNVRELDSERYSYDALGSMSERCSSAQGTACLGERWAYIYDANDERVLRYRFEQGTEEFISPGDARWATTSGGVLWNPTLRDERGQVLVDRREGDGIPGTELETYVWRGDALLGSELQPQGQVRYFALDHLGSVRAIADGAGSLLESRSYEPYGFNHLPLTLDERRAWAGHERDSGVPGKPEHDLDYMHARFYKPAWGRFLSVDPVGGDLTKPQSWNRYAYVMGNPLKYLDPRGRAAVLFTGLGNDARSPLHSLAHQLAATGSVGPARVFRHQDRALALDFVLTELKRNPRQPVIIAGHSAGAASAASLSRFLGESSPSVPVNLLVTLDPAFDTTAGKSTAVAENYFQTNDLLGGGQLSGDRNTDVSNTEVGGVTHKQLDDHLIDSGTLLTEILRVVAEQRDKEPDPENRE